jgi:hypothetical protein
MKTCSTCNVEKPFSEFYLKQDNADGYSKKCKECKKAYDAKRYNPEAVWARAIKRKYGITASTYYEMLENQGFACAACGSMPEPERKLCIDHCHSTGRVRGLLCDKCNQALGLLQDNPQTLSNLITYLAK